MCELNKSLPAPEAPAQADEKRDGPVYGKFIVERTDGRSAPGEKHHGCEYFVLDTTHDIYAVPALEAYARACERLMPELAESIRGRWICVPRSETEVDRPLLPKCAPEAGERGEGSS